MSDQNADSILRVTAWAFFKSKEEGLDEDTKMMVEDITATLQELNRLRELASDLYKMNYAGSYEYLNSDFNALLKKEESPKERIKHG